MNALLLSFQKSSLREIFSTTVLICLFTTLLFGQAEQGKIVNPSMTIVPNDVDISDPVNIGLFNALPVGDINGDGVGDMVFNSWSADERTPELMDNVAKSVITLDVDVNSSIVYYGTTIYGAGDFNADGFDDIVDVRSGYIHFGSSGGISGDSLFLGFSLSNYPKKVFYAGDMNGDGYSEILIGNTYGSDSLTIYSGPDPTPILFDPFEGEKIFETENGKYYSYDYDLDGDREFCLFGYSNGNLVVKWFRLDKENGQMQWEHSEVRPYINEPSVHFPLAFSDINGDHLEDICHVYYQFDTIDSIPRFNIEAFLGLSTEPYFDLAVDIQVWNTTRMLYPTGDFDNNGADDWYSKLTEDSIVVYFGNPDVTTSGFQKVQYATGNDKELLFPGSSFYTISDVPTFYFNDDTIADLYFNYWSYDDNLQFDMIGTAIVTGGGNPDFENPVIIGKSGSQAFKSLEYGYSTKNIGDLNQDGYPDWGVLAKSACYLDVFYGGSTIDSIPDIRFLLPQKGKAESFDWTSGDLNGDGWIDIAISNSSVQNVIYAFGYISERENVYIFYGNPNMQNVYNFQDANVVLHDNGTFAEFGKNIAIVGDYNADGYNDLIVGGGKHRHCLREAFVYFGGEDIGPEPDIVISVPCTTCGISFASPITPCGDINGNGYDDFTLGDPNNGPGQCLVYIGGPFADSLYDMAIINPAANGIGFGRKTSHVKGDFDGDGFNDLIQHSYFKKNIYIYKGGPQFDTVPDYIFHDSVFTHHIGTVEFIDRSSEFVASDFLVNYRYNNVYYSKLYQGGSIQAQEGLPFNGISGYSSLSVASGDFNNDGLTEIFTGYPNEMNYGWPKGGIVKLYVPANYVISNIDPANNPDSYLNIFPNPVRSEITVEFEVEKPGDVSILIINLMGQIETQFDRHFTAAGNTRTEFNPGGLKNGVYILEIRQGNSISRRKFIFAK